MPPIVVTSVDATGPDMVQGHAGLRVPTRSEIPTVLQGATQP